MLVAVGVCNTAPVDGPIAAHCMYVCVHARRRECLNAQIARSRYVPCGQLLLLAFSHVCNVKSRWVSPHVQRNAAQ